MKLRYSIYEYIYPLEPNTDMPIQNNTRHYNTYIELSLTYISSGLVLLLCRCALRECGATLIAPRQHYKLSRKDVKEHVAGPSSVQAFSISPFNFSEFARFACPSSPNAFVSTSLTSAFTASMVPVGALPVRYKGFKPCPLRTSISSYAILRL